MLLYRFYRMITFPFRWARLKFWGDGDVAFYEKMGSPTENRPKGDLVWVHCDDFSEAGDVLKGVVANMPDRVVLLTYNTRQSADRFDNIPGVICQFAPLDNAVTVRKFLRFWEPTVAIYTGAELRPIQLAQLKKLEIPSFLVNGHLSDKSYRWRKLMKRLARKTMRNFKFVWAVDNMQTLRLANLGANDVKSQELIQGPGKMREIILKIRQIIY